MKSSTQNLEFKSEIKQLSNMDEKNWVRFKLKKGEKIFACKRCMTLSTRPRAQYDNQGICNACHHTEAKRNGTINWDQRWKYLEKLCDEHRSKNGDFDCIVPGSGGKDSMYVAWKMKHELKMHPLCVTLTPQMPTEIGRKNFDIWVDHGFDNIFVSPDPEAYRKLATVGFVESGQPKMPFVSGITTAVLKVAMKFDIPFVMYGDEGETEYGGVTKLAEKPYMNRKETMEYYFSKDDPTVHIGKIGITKEDVRWWMFPSQEEMDESGVFMVFWSWFEDWDPYDHYLFAKKHCGFMELPHRSIGTYTNFAQLDDDLQDLHAYLMWVKFGFGRCWSDACIDIRRGAMDRKQAKALIKAYDGEFPEPYLKKYCDYFKMTEEEFWETVDSFRSQDIFEKVAGKWKVKFDIDSL